MSKTAMTLGSLALGLGLALVGCSDTQNSSTFAYTQDASVLAESRIETPDLLTVCGQFSGHLCSEGQFCNFPVSTPCGSSTNLGTCAPIPESCPRDENPVCGCNGTTYRNRCDAASNAVSIRSLGACR